MHQAEHLERFEAALVARWRVIAPMMPPNGDLKRHLAERRSIPDVLEKRRSVTDILRANPASAELHRLSGMHPPCPEVERSRPRNAA